MEVTDSKVGPVVSWAVIDGMSFVDNWTFEWFVPDTTERKHEGAGAALPTVS